MTVSAASGSKTPSRLPKKAVLPLERFMLPNPQWQEGYESFSVLFGKPIGWLVFCEEHGPHRIIRLDRKQNCPFFYKSQDHQRECEAFITKFTDQLLHNEETADRLPLFYRCAFGKHCLIYPLRYLGSLKGFLIFCCVKKPEKDVQCLIDPFHYF